MPTKKTPQGVRQKSKSSGSGKGTKRDAKYIKLKQPSDVMAYVQYLINKLRDNNREFDELGKITNLLNTWIAAHKDYIETEELRKLRAELDAFKEQMAEK